MIFHAFSLLALLFTCFALTTVNSEDARSLDPGLHSENEDGGFYTENFHSAAWVFRGDDVSPDNSPRCLSKRPRPVASKLAKATGKKCHRTVFALSTLRVPVVNILEKMQDVCAEDRKKSNPRRQKVI